MDLEDLQQDFSLKRERGGEAGGIAGDGIKTCNSRGDGIKRATGTKSLLLDKYWNSLAPL